MAQRTPFVVMAVWLALSIGLSLAHEGFTANAVTRFGILGTFALSLLWYWRWGRVLVVRHPRRTFLAFSVVNALIGESWYMVSRPLDTSLLITRQTAPLEALRHWAVDLTLTAPAYVGIFSVVWWLIHRYRYSPFSYFFLIGLGQALGDGNAFFLANPVMLLFVPYVMLNYWAMSFVPYLVIRGSIDEATLKPGKVAPVIVTLGLMPVTYFCAGAIIITAGRLLGWLPRS